MNCPFCDKQVKSSEVMCPFCGRILPVEASGPGAKPGVERSIGDVMPSGMILQGKYEIQKLIHSGGMGYVYAAIDTRLRRWVALKQVKEQIKSKTHLDKLELEALSMAKLNHPGIAMVLDHFTENKYYFVVVEYVPGKTLAQIFEERGHKLSESDVIKWMLPVCDAINYIHSQGFIYRDVSPDNIMLTEEAKIKMIDFGTLREVSSLIDKKVGKEGKFGFTPPEQWQGSPVPQSDVFSIAATIYYLLTDYLPVSEECRITGKPQPSDYSPEYTPIRSKNAQVSAGLDSALQRALQIDISKRYASVNDLKQVLSGEIRETNVYKQAPDNENRPVPVYENKAGENPVLGIDCTVFDFGKVAPGGKVSKTVTIRNFGNGVLQGEAQPSEPWIEISPGMWVVVGVMQTITITIDTSYLLLEKPVSGFININSNGGSGKIEVRATASINKGIAFKPWLLAPIAIVLMTVIGIANCPVAKPPLLESDAQSNYSYSGLKLGLAKIDPHTITIKNTGGQKITGTVTCDKSWLHVDQDAVNLSPGKQDITFWVDTIGMKNRFTDKGIIHIKTNGGSLMIPVNLSTTAVIYADDFSDTDSGWSYSVASSRGTYTDGGFNVTLQKANTFYVRANPKIEQYEDFILEVDVKSKSTVKNSAVGIVYRMQDLDNFYVIFMCPGYGTYKKDKYVDDTPKSLREWTNASSISNVNEINKVKIVCIGTLTEFYLNNIKIENSYDDSFKKGYIWLTALGGTESSIPLYGDYADVLFDNLKISVP